MQMMNNVGHIIENSIVEHDNDESLCKICMVNSIECVFVECGHMMSCINCANKLKICPVCRKDIFKAIKVYK